MLLDSRTNSVICLFNPLQFVNDEKHQFPLLFHQSIKSFDFDSSAISVSTQSCLSQISIVSSLFFSFFPPHSRGMGYEMNAALMEKGAAAEFVKPGSIQYPRRKFSAPPAVRQRIRFMRLNTFGLNFVALFLFPSFSSKKNAKSKP
ncbi:hypothetical protein RHGRI_035508 [Rhododendron griersonianum]|uniref:Uncharacterized protein n=1 Tax=Rhododendron griersonianum TaxID=479676 RepID=A0AAV6HPZ8_9ERIC|nr:hypothetical protein RHGRI_035508 [Rhododendron griersonianum]